MIRMFVRHPVNDFDEWKEAYDDFDDERAERGVTGHAVFQAADDPEDVTVLHDFESLQAARDFAGSDLLREVMGRAGVVGEPTIWFTTPV